MEEPKNIQDLSEEELHRLSYRNLQQIAKNMTLQSNVKKLVLIELIYAKLHKSPDELNEIVQRVKLERQLVSQGNKRKAKNKMRVQAMEISSTNNTACMSPPIAMTPKRHTTPDPPYYRQITRTPRSPKSRSDRVLRSYNAKKYKRPNYSLLNNSMIGLVKAAEIIENKECKETQISIMTYDRSMPRVNVTARCSVRKMRASTSGGVAQSRDAHTQMGLSSRMPTLTIPAMIPAKNIRTVREMYPREESEQARTNNQYIGYRRSDGVISKINAVVQKACPKQVYQCEAPNPDNFKNVEVTIQDIINSNIDALTFTNTSAECYLADQCDYQEYNYPNMCVLSDVEPKQVPFIQSSNQSNVNSLQVYYHKSRGEEIRNHNTDQSIRTYEFVASVPPRPVYPYTERRLPTIEHVFTHLAHPQASALGAANLPFDMTRNNNNNSVIECFYNIKSEMLQSPLLPIRTTALTTCVFTTTKTVPIAMLPTPFQCAVDTFCSPPYEQNNIYPTISYVDNTSGDPMAVAEQEMTLRRYHEAYNASNSSTETLLSQDLGAPASIPEMVEDALELISQDGDYMERINMDVRMQCILCSWAGSKIVLENHIRKEHPNNIIVETKPEWNVTYKLSTLINQEIWLSHVSEYAGCMYILSVKYQDPDCFMASFTTLATVTGRKVGSITIYNKVTGEPFSWQGHIQELPSNLPYDNDVDCLTVELSKLELLPNSANLKLINRALVLNSPNKVVVGQPELDDIHIILFVTVNDN